MFGTCLNGRDDVIRFIKTETLPEMSSVQSWIWKSVNVLWDKTVLYSNGDFGVNHIAEDMAKEYGVQNQIFDQVQTPAGVELLLTANSAISKAAKTLQREVLSHIYLQTLLQRNY